MTPNPTKEELRKGFEANMLDGDSLDHCGGAMIDAKEAFEYFASVLVPPQPEHGEWEKDFDYYHSRFNSHNEQYCNLGPEGVEKLKSLIRSAIRSAVSSHESKLKKRLAEEVGNTPIEKSHTYSSENADVYRAFDAGQEHFKNRVLAILNRENI